MLAILGAFVPDHVDFSKLNIASHVTPRVLAYNNYRLSTLIASDEISKSSFGARPRKDMPGCTAKKGGPWDNECGEGSSP